MTFFDYMKDIKKNIASKNIEKYVANATFDYSEDDIQKCLLNPDPLLSEAAKIIIENNKASSGLLGRFLNIKFDRGIKILDQLTHIGVLSDQKGDAPRKILLNYADALLCIKKYTLFPDSIRATINSQIEISKEKEKKLHVQNTLRDIAQASGYAFNIDNVECNRNWDEIQSTLYLDSHDLLSACVAKLSIAPPSFCKIFLVDSLDKNIFADFKSFPNIVSIMRGREGLSYLSGIHCDYCRLIIVSEIAAFTSTELYPIIESNRGVDKYIFFSSHDTIPDLDSLKNSMLIKEGIFIPDDMLFPNRFTREVTILKSFFEFEKRYPKAYEMDSPNHILSLEDILIDDEQLQEYKNEALSSEEKEYLSSMEDLPPLSPYIIRSKQIPYYQNGVYFDYIPFAIDLAVKGKRITAFMLSYGFNITVWDAYHLITLLQFIPEGSYIIDSDGYLNEALSAEELENAKVKYGLLDKRLNRVKESICDISKFKRSARAFVANKNNREYLDNMPSGDTTKAQGESFEKYCISVLERNGFHNICSTPSSGDHGVDIIAEKYSVNYAIQCKCYSDKVGNSAIQEVFTGKAYYNCDIAVVMTNSSFTSQAIEEAEKVGVKLWDKDEIERMTND